MVHQSSQKSLNDINGAVCIFGKMWICLACLLIPGSWSVAICVDSIVLQYGSLDFVSLYIIKGDIIGVACLDRCILAPESEIASMIVLVGLGGESI